MPAIQRVTLEEITTFLREHPQGKIIDVLTPETYVQRHIPGSMNACVFEINFPKRVKELIPDISTPLLLYGAGRSEDSEIAAQKLVDIGYTDVCFFSGGLEDWLAEKLPVEGNAPDSALQEDMTLPLFKCYNLATDKSEIRWIGRNSSHSHNGTLRCSAGHLSFLDGRDKPGTGSVTVDMHTINCADLAGSSMLSVLISHLESRDFFDVASYPTAKLQIVQLLPLSNRSVTCCTHHLKGRLHLLCTEQDIECDVSLRNLSKNKLSLYCQLTLDRTRWGVKYGSARFFRFLGMHSVDDGISLDVSLLFTADDGA